MIGGVHVSRWLAALLAATAIVLIGLAATAPGQQPVLAPPSSSCPPILFYFSRGSGQSPIAQRGLGSPGFELYELLRGRYQGALAVMANPYRAVNVRSGLDPFGTTYTGSVANGVQSEIRNLEDLSEICPHALLILGGYSQGAQVTRSVLASLDASVQSRVAAVLLFGDPYFRYPDANVDFLQPESDKARFVDTRRGILLQRPFAKGIPISKAFSGRVFSWCHRRDVICQGLHVKKRTAIPEHLNYGQDLGDMQGAMAVVASRLARMGFQPASYPFHVEGTCNFGGGCALTKWSGPGRSGFAAVGALTEGATVAVVCQRLGQRVTGPNGVTSLVWDHLTDGAYVSDYYVDTPEVGAFSPPIPQCR